MSHGILNYFWSAIYQKTFPNCANIYFSQSINYLFSMFFFQYILHCLYRDLITLMHGAIILTVRIIVAWLSIYKSFNAWFTTCNKKLLSVILCHCFDLPEYADSSLIRNASRAIYRLFYVNITDNWDSLRKKAF